MKAKGYTKSFVRYAALFAALVAFYLAAMTLVYAIPDSAVAARAQAAADTLPERDWAFYNSYPTSQDTYTDRIMMNQNLETQQQGNPFVAALANKGYARYWHGYQILLRPMLVFLGYDKIINLCFFVLLGLLGAVLFVGQRRLGVAYSLAVLLSFIFVHGTIIPGSLQYMNTFVLGYGGALCALLLYRPGTAGAARFGGTLLFAIGSATAFFDLLTTPLVSLGIPLVTLLCMDWREAKAGAKQGVLGVVRLSALWGLAYGLTWAAKWVVGTLVLQRNVLADALETAQHRTVGENWSLTIWDLAVGGNFRTLFGVVQIFVFILLAVLWALLYWKARAPGSRKALAPPLLLVAAMPYLWYSVLQDHSLHIMFTFRTQYLTLLSVFCLAALCVDWGGLYRRIAERKEKPPG